MDTKTAEAFHVGTLNNAKGGPIGFGALTAEGQRANLYPMKRAQAAALVSLLNECDFAELTADLQRSPSWHYARLRAFQSACDTGALNARSGDECRAQWDAWIADRMLTATDTGRLGYHYSAHPRDYPLPLGYAELQKP